MKTFSKNLKKRTKVCVSKYYATRKVFVTVFWPALKKTVENLTHLFMKKNSFVYL